MTLFLRKSVVLTKTQRVFVIKYTNVYFFMILKYKYDFYGYNFKLCCIISRRIRFYPNNLLWSSKRCKTYL